MSEFSNHQELRLADLKQVFQAITYKQSPNEAIKKYETTIQNATPDDVVLLVHQLVESGMPMDDIKVGVSRMLNVLQKTLCGFPDIAPEEGTFFDICVKNNYEAVEKLNSLRPYILKINKSELSEDEKREMTQKWLELQKITQYYEVKEQVLFPLVEKYIPDYKCIMVMWSIHDDTRKNLKEVIEMLTSSDKMDLKKFNRKTGETFYNIYTMKYREEKLLYPFILNHIPNDEIEKLWNESVEIGFPFYNPQKKEAKSEEQPILDGQINLKSGSLTVEQIVLIFSHLPVDITFVDENNKVCFYSTPKKRVFTRTNAVIGRDVRNCHPHESVHVVEKIVDSFRSGEKDRADFWIDMKGTKVLIQYFAVRNENDEYKGVLEVTQEISFIQSLEGQKRLLDWESKENESTKS